MKFRGKEKDESFLPLPNGIEKEKIKPKFNIQDHSSTIEWIVNQIKRINWNLILCLTIYWIITIHHFERIVPKRAINKCQWDKWERWEDKSAAPHRIALIGDPQIVDEHTYSGRPEILNYFVKKISDNYLYRNNAYLQSHLDPDSTIFLGDLFDGGREWEDKMWLKEYQRFNKIFPKKVNRKTIQSLPGNHDIGFEKIDYDVAKRFSTFFGESNDYHELGNHSIILLDSISLSHTDPKIKKPAMDFLNTLNDKLNSQFPRILLTHVPLYRFNDKQLCGPLRESKSLFPMQKGKQYQTIIDYDVTQSILGTVHPDIIFSGDDHDYCDVQHSYTYNGQEKLAREITMKTASMTNGIRYPAYQLLSLNNPYNPNPKRKVVEDDESENAKEPEQTFSTEMCYLPDPYLALKLYVLALITSIAIILVNFVFPTLFNSIINIIFRTLLNNRTSLPLFDQSKWKPQSSGHLIGAERSISNFVVHSMLILVIIYILFGIYYRKV